MKTISIALFAALAALASMAAAADEKPNYTFVQAGFGGGNAEGAQLSSEDFILPLDTSLSDTGWDQDVRGYSAKASVALFDDFFASGAYSFVDRNGFEYTDVTSWQINAGYVRQIDETSTFDLSAVYRRDEVKARNQFNINPEFGEPIATFVDSRETYKGVGINFGVRNNVTDWLELYGRGGYLWGEWEGALSIDTGAVWNITDFLAITTTFEYVNVDDEGNDYERTHYQAGVRLKF